MSLSFRLSFLFLALFAFSFSAIAQKDKKDDKDPLASSTFSGLKFRSIGPAYASGRIADIAVNPCNHSEMYLGVAAGNVWKTDNAGVTWKPVFDNYGAWSIADVELDPNNPHVVWVGTGEYNSQRAIGYGDGVYLSRDGGKSFKNMGLKKSEHIGRIAIDPRNSHVYVAAQGPLWGAGGERGLYKTTDMGESWEKILDISENTGVTDIVFDPRNPDILYAASYQRRRRVFTLINGGPESAIYKSEDAGKTWRKLKSGLPSSELGRIGLAVSPANPDYVYAIVEAAKGKSGFFRSTNRGETWQKMSSYISRSPQYYNRIYADPKDPDKVFSMDTYSHYTEDGGKNFTRLGLSHKHVDDHALWIDPDDTDHLIIGCDGGLYESFDMGKNWRHTPNLPIMQFYRVAVDNDKPFYNVYGGTQDNNSLGGPSRTINAHGIVNDDWFVTNGGDGFFSQIDPKNPNIVYAEAQYGYAIRFDRQSRESISIKPQPPKGEAYRWNWNAPLIISPHSNTRLYFAANKLFRSDDRGNSWKVISPDLTRQIDRNQLKVMGKVQSPDAVSKNASTSLFGNIVSLSESPVTENLIYAGTDDGLVQITQDAGENWRKEDKFPGVPEMTYVSCLLASEHDANTVYAAFDGRKNNDLKPHLLKSTDKGKTWKSIAANLPERGTVYSIAEDHKNKNLLFAGTEFGVFFSIDGGKKWVQLKNGIPVTAVRDIKIQKHEDDLVLATFGRGFYILDNYAPLRETTPELLKKEHHLFDIKDALMFVEEGTKYGQGATYYAGENPPVAATFTYYVKESLKTRTQKRRAAEKKAFKNKEDIDYPSFEELRKEDEEEKPYLLFVISDKDGNVVRKLTGRASKGIHRIHWNFRYPSFRPVTKPGKNFGNKGGGMFVMPGEYKVHVYQYLDDEVTDLGLEAKFNAVPLENTTLPAKNRAEMVAFQQKASELARSVQGAVNYVNNLKTRIGAIKQALYKTPAPTADLMKKARQIEDQINAIDRKLTGDESISKRNANQPPSLSGRVNTIVYSHWRSTSAPTQTMRQQYEIAGELFENLLTELNTLIGGDLKELEEKMEKLGSPWTPDRLPQWKK